MAAAAKLCATSSSVVDDCKKYLSSVAAKACADTHTNDSFVAMLGDANIMSNLFSAQLCHANAKFVLDKDDALAQEQLRKLDDMMAAAKRIVEQHASAAFDLMVEAVKPEGVDSTLATVLFSSDPFHCLWKAARAFEIQATRVPTQEVIARSIVRVRVIVILA